MTQLGTTEYRDAAQALMASTDEQLVHCYQQVRQEIERRKLVAIVTCAAQSRMTDEKAVAIALSEKPWALEWNDYCKVQNKIKELVAKGVQRNWPQIRTACPGRYSTIFQGSL